MTRAVALAGGFAIAAGVHRVLMRPQGATPPGTSARGSTLLIPTLAAAVTGALLLIRLPARIEGWRLALVALALLVLITITRS